MTFTTHFKPHYADQYDCVSCEVDGFTCTATIYRDDNYFAPDKLDAGFWPSLDPKSAGYIGDKTAAELVAAMAEAMNVMRAWRNDEWFYVGVAVTVSKADIMLTGKYDHALWGVECNYPHTDNSYLLEVANGTLPEALDDARAKLALLCA